MTSCDALQRTVQDVDLAAFESFGGTLFADPALVTMKEIHLDKGALVDQRIVIEGDVVEIGKYKTYMVVSDNTARMLVVLTEIYGGVPIDDKMVGRKIRLLGTVEDGKKGLPFMQAKALALLE